MKVWGKLDKFYLVLTLILVAMSALLVVTFRGIFSAYLNVYEIDQKDLKADAKIEKDTLDEVYAWVKDKKSTPLLIRG